MMLLRKCGTERPRRKATGRMRGGVIACVILLLACVLMAGAVSAAESQTITQDSEFNFTTGNYATISQGGWYRLNETGNGTISITVNSGDVILNSTNGVKMTGNITISGNANVTIDGMDLLVTSATLYDTNRVAAIKVASGNPGIVLQNSNITFDSSVDGKKGYVIVSNSALNSSRIVNNKIWNVPGHALSIHGLQNGKSMEVSDNMVSMNPDEEYGGGDGRALLKIWQADVQSPVTFTVTNNAITNNNKNRQVAVVRFDESPNASDDINVEITGNSIDDDSASPYLYNGTVTTFKSLKIANSDNTLILTPGLNQTGVKWTGDADNGWELVVSKTDNYKLMDDVSLKSMKVTASDVTIDGNRGSSVKVTLTKPDGELIPITVSGSSVTLKNLDITTTETTSSTLSPGAEGVVQISGADGKLQNSKLDFSKVSGTPSIAAVRLSGANGEVSNTEIINGHSTASSSQCIVVSGDNAKITNNKLTPGKALATLKGDGTTSSGSVAVRVAGSTATTITVEDNIIISTWSGSDTTRNSGVSLDTSSSTPFTVKITGNTFTLNDAKRNPEDNKALGGYGSVLYINPSISSASVTATITNNIIKKGTYLIYGDGNDGATSISVTGTVSKNDFGAITGKKYVSSTDVTFSTDGITEDNNVEPAVPEIPKVTPTQNTDGTTSVTPPMKEDTTFDSGSNTATIGKKDSSAAVIQISGDGVKRDETTGAITAPASAEIKAVYNEAPAAAGSSGTDVTYQLNISLKDAGALNGIQLPIISPAYDPEKANLVTIGAPGFTPLAMITATGDVTGINNRIKDSGIELTFTVPKTAVDSIGLDKIRAFHVKSDKTVEGPLPVTITPAGANYLITVKGSTFSTYALATSSAPVSSDSSSSGNTENAFRVLFDAKGGSFVQPATGLSYGDRIAKPADPERSGYSFAGWYKDEAGTIAWVFSEDAVPGDISLYAKWVPAGSQVSSVTDTQKPTEKATAIATAGSTVKQTASATQVSTASATTAPAGISPTMTQAPAPLAGLLLGLLGGCILLRRKE